MPSGTIGRILEVYQLHWPRRAASNLANAPLMVS